MTERREADAFSFQAMLFLCAIWGVQQVAIKLAAPDLAPIYQASFRSGISAGCVALVMAWRGGWQARTGTLKPGLFAGILFAVEFLLLALALQLTTAGHVAVFLYTSPVFSALGLHILLPSERLTRKQWLGIGCCFLGIAVAFIGGGSPAPTTLDSHALLGDALAIGAGAAWGATTVVVRGSALSEAPASLTLFYQLATAFVTLLVVALVSTPIATMTLSSTAITSVLFQGFIVSFASYLAWFTLLRRYKASTLAVFSFMTPVFGVTAGVIVLGEPLRSNFVIGAMLVLAGILIVSRAARRRPPVPASDRA